MLSNKLTFLIAFVLVLSAIALGEPTAKTVGIRSVVKFCLLLPRYPGYPISDNAISFCTGNIPIIPGVKIFPRGFIQSTHYYKKPTRYIQMTGRLNIGAYDLSSEDQGGQNDPSAPDGASCLDWPYFVQVIEPNEGIYCLRCCKRRGDCPTDTSYGCRDLIGGRYD